MNILVQLSGFLPHHGLSFMPAGCHICSFSPPLSPLHPFAFLPFSSPTLSPRPPFPSVPSNFSYLFFPFEAFSLFSLHFLSFFSPFLSSHPTVVDPRPALCQPHVTTSPMIIIIHLTCSLSLPPFLSQSLILLPRVHFHFPNHSSTSAISLHSV